MEPIRRILFTGDLWRTDATGLGANQNQNIRWLHAWLGTTLEQVLGCPVELLTDDGLAFDSGRQYAHLRRARDVDGWAWLDAQPTAPAPLRDFMDARFLSDTLVVGFELPGFLRRELSQRDVPWVDVRFSPLRFAPDLFLEVDGNLPGFRERLQCWQVPRGFLQMHAAALRARFARESPPSIPPGTAIFLGQLPVDRSLFVEGRLVGLRNVEDKLREALEGHPDIWFKPHPHDRQREALLKLLSGFGAVRVVEENIYALFARGQGKRFVALSSSTSEEAPWFGCEVRRLLPRVQENRVTVDAAFFSAELWNCLLTGSARAPGGGERFLPNTLRNSLRVAWGYEQIDPVTEQLEGFRRTVETSAESVESLSGLRGDVTSLREENQRLREDYAQLRHELEQLRASLEFKRTEEARSTRSLERLRASLTSLTRGRS